MRKLLEQQRLFRQKDSRDFSSAKLLWTHLRDQGVWQLECPDNVPAVPVLLRGQEGPGEALVTSPTTQTLLQIKIFIPYVWFYVFVFEVKTMWVNYKINFSRLKKLKYLFVKRCFSFFDLWYKILLNILNQSILSNY